MTLIHSKSYLNFCDYFSSEGIEFFDTPDFDPFPVSDNDTSVTVDQKYLGRLDLIAYDSYGDSNLWWPIALANDLEVIPTQMRLGQILRIPASESISVFLDKVRRK